MTDRTGGPAFPVGAGVTGRPAHDGMALRDYFAAKAMAALVGGGRIRNHVIAQEVHAVAAQKAYAMADAMLDAREATS